MHPRAGPSRALGQWPNCSGACEGKAGTDVAWDVDSIVAFKEEGTTVDVGRAANVEKEVFVVVL